MLQELLNAELSYMLDNEEECPINLFGHEIDTGWEYIVSKCLLDIARFDKNKVFRVHQIKQKLGTLRVYYNTTEIYEYDSELAEHISNIILGAGYACAYICEKCGMARGSRIKIGGYITIRCENHTS